jgi:hypothetical protein
VPGGATGAAAVLLSCVLQTAGLWPAAILYGFLFLFRGAARGTFAGADLAAAPERPNKLPASYGFLFLFRETRCRPSISASYDG